MPTALATADAPTTGPTIPRPATDKRRRLIILAVTSVLVLTCGGAAVQRSLAKSPDPTSQGSQARQVLAQDNLNGSSNARAANPATPAAAKAAAAKATDKPKPKTPAVSGFTPNSATIPGSGRVYLGAAGDSQALSRSTGISLSDHSYAHFTGKVPAGRMITVKASESWRTVAAAGPGSALYNDIVRWAQTIKARGGVIMFAYHHEPEGALSSKYGTAADFIQAWRRVVTIFRSQGVRNVIYTWQMTAWAFRAPASDSGQAAKWYPGDAYVDSVGADAYNWATCGEGSGRWMELQALGDPVLAFARAHGKQASFPEFASHADSRRAQWVYNALRYIAVNRSRITGAFYFHRGPTVAANNDCKWPLSTSAEYGGYRAMGRIGSYFTP